MPGKPSSVQAIENKIKRLKEVRQSDGSTVGGLLFASMEDVVWGNSAETIETTTNDGAAVNQRTLSNAEVIDNASLLILAATETELQYILDISTGWIFGDKDNIAARKQRELSYWQL